MEKFPKVKYPNDSAADGLLEGDCVVTEKLDGGNFRFTWNEDGDLIFGSRNVEFTRNGEPLPIDEISHDFRHAVRYVKDIVPDEPPEVYKSITFYGEAMHRHTLTYDDIDYEAPEKGSPYPGGNTPNVVFFDARVNDEWLDWHDFRACCQNLGLETTRTLAHGPGKLLRDKGDTEIPEESMFGGQPEGIIVRRLDGSVRAKKVTDDFKEKNAQAFNDPTKAQSEAGEFVASFVTEARIRKRAQALVDEGDYDSLCMEMMQDLPIAVLRDVMEEEGWNLLNNEYGFECEFDSDFKSEVRSKVSSRCATVLKTELQRL